MKSLCLLILIVHVFIAVSLFSKTDGPKVGEVRQIEIKTGEVVVSSPKANEEIKMGDLLYVRIEGKPVLLRATFPMMSLARCKPEGPNRELWKNAKKGMPVFRWHKGIDSDADSGNEFAGMGMHIDPEVAKTRAVQNARNLVRCVDSEGSRVAGCVPAAKKMQEHVLKNPPDAYVDLSRTMQKQFNTNMRSFKAVWRIK